MEITITKGQVQALLKIAPKKDIRYYLNGALLEVNGDGAWLVATDGHVLLAGLVTGNIETREQGRWIIPRDALEIAAKRKKYAVALVVGDRCSLGGLPFEPVDGIYPDWRRVIGSPCDHRAHDWPQFNPELLCRVHDAGKLYDGVTKAAAAAMSYPCSDGSMMHYRWPTCLGVVAALRADALDAVEQIPL